MTRRHLHPLSVLTTAAATVIPAACGYGQVYRWIDGTVIPGTENISPSPNVSFPPKADLSWADLVSQNLSGSRFPACTLVEARFTGTNLSWADLSSSLLTSAVLTDANIIGTKLGGTSYGGIGLSLAQLYSTASYQQRNLEWVGLNNNDLTSANFASVKLVQTQLYHSTLTAADFRGANLTSAALFGSALMSADFTGAVIEGASFNGTTSRGFTLAQLYSTASYQQRDLRCVGLSYNELTSADFASFDLSSARFHFSDLASVDFTNAIVAGCNFQGTTSSGFTLAQLYSTTSYQQRDLPGIGLAGNNLSSANFAFTNLAGAYLSSAILTSAKFSGANLKGAWLEGSTLTSADLAEADLTSARLASSRFTSADLTGAMVKGADFSSTLSRGLSLAQLYSTASFQQRDLAEISLASNDLSSACFASVNFLSASFRSSYLVSANLVSANLTSANLDGSMLAFANLTSACLARTSMIYANFTLADLRQATGFVPHSKTTVRGTILPDGVVNGLVLLAREKLTVHDNPVVPVRINSEFFLFPSSIMEVVLGDAVFNPTVVTVAPTLGGYLKITLDPTLDPAELVDVPIDLFDWYIPPSSQFETVYCDLDPSLYAWDVSDLYMGGTVRLRAIPEGGGVWTLMLGSGLTVRRCRRRSRSA